MIRKRVVSKNIHSIGYFEGLLEVQFLDGSIYQYKNVDEIHYVHMINLPHPGTYLAANIIKCDKGTKIN